MSKKKKISNNYYLFLTPSQTSFLNLVKKILESGRKKSAGVGFGLQSISKIFPLLQKKAEFNYEPFKLSDILLFYSTPHP